ncbi:MAG: sarcosine oxidase subunit delta [Casimicrobiaceae bacterium]
MLLIPCPWCGPRNQVEFTYGGDATVRRPPADAPESAWVDYVYFRDNPCGPLDELWLHGAGCRQWIVVRRDTRNHDILGSRALPGVQGEAGGESPDPAAKCGA